ncbi:MAG TPA: hypothetical protein VFG87_04065 [Amycolatopsis sp.]|jgi:hypothetical protein|nr:hypothetical protein [Amycolatopsis sp.]
MCEPTATEPATDLLGTPLSEVDERVLAVYSELKKLLAEDGLAPSTAANLRAALAPVAIAVTDLGLCFEHLIELDI